MDQHRLYAGCLTLSYSHGVAGSLNRQSINTGLVHIVFSVSKQDAVYFSICLQLETSKVKSDFTSSTDHFSLDWIPKPMSESEIHKSTIKVTIVLKYRVAQKELWRNLRRDTSRYSPLLK